MKVKHQLISRDSEYQEYTSMSIKYLLMNNINSILVTFHKYLLKAAVRPRLVGHLCLYCTSKLNLSQPGLAMQQCLNLQSMVHSHVSTPSCNLPQNSTFRNRNFPSFIFTKFLNPKVRCGSIQERLREKKLPSLQSSWTLMC